MITFNLLPSTCRLIIYLLVLRIFKEITFLKVDYSILGHEEKGKFCPNLLLSKFSLRFCFNSHHPLFSENYCMPGTAPGDAGNQLENFLKEGKKLSNKLSCTWSRERKGNSFLYLCISFHPGKSSYLRNLQTETGD